MKKKSSPLEIIPTVEIVEKIDVDVSAESLEKSLNEKYNEDFIKLLKRVAYEIAVVGLPISEACLYVGMDYEKLLVLMETDLLINRLIETKDLEYKRGLLKAVSEKAKTDDRMSQWLLERRYPDEYNSRKGTNKKPGQEDSDLLGVALEFIQKSGDSSPLVTEKSGRAFVLKRTSGENKDVMRKISEILK